MDLLSLQYFKTVAKTQHITKAAEELMISQSALSKAISRLESDLGTVLFERTASRIKLNTAGEAFLRHTNYIFHELELGRREVLELAGLEFGELSLATSIPDFLPDLMEQFLAKHSAVRLRQSLMPLPTMKDPLLHGDLDFAFSSAPVEGPNLIWTPLLEEEMFLMVPASHRLADRDSVLLKDFREDSFICPSAGYGPRNIADIYCSNAGFPPKVVFEGTFPHMLDNLVSLGLGVGFVQASVVKQRSGVVKKPSAPFSIGRLRILKIKEPECRSVIGVTRSKQHQLSKAAQSFFDFTVSYFNNLQEEINFFLL